MELEAETVGAAQDRGDEAELGGAQQQGAEGESDSEEAPLTSGRRKKAEAPTGTFPCWRLVLAMSFLSLGLASYAAAHVGGNATSSAQQGGEAPASGSSAAPQAAPPAEAPAQAVDSSGPAAGAAPQQGAEDEEGEDEDGPEQAAVGSGGPSLLCLTWTSRSRHEEAMMPEVQRQLSDCEEHYIFTDKDARGDFYPDINTVAVPSQAQERLDESWLRHRTMVGLLPAWTHLLENGDAENHDWVLNVKFDQFVSPAKVRLAIVAYLDALRRGSDLDKLSARGPLMFAWGSAFLFNRKMVKRMKKRWHKISRSEEVGSPGSGCPLFLRGTAGWPRNCTQELAYPIMASHVMHVPSFLAQHCGEPGTMSNGQPLPLACWDMDSSPFGQSEEGQLRAVKLLAAMRNFSDRKAAEDHFVGTPDQESWEPFYKAREVPIISSVAFPSVLKLASTLLGR